MSQTPSPVEAAPSRPRRLSRDQLIGAVLALLIGYTSILSAVVAWRASLSSIDAGRLESLAVQQQARREQLLARSEGVISQDLRLVTGYREHALAARELFEQADAVRTDNPELADDLDLEAHGRLAIARAMQPFVLAQSRLSLAEDGAVDYDEERLLDLLRAADTELRDLQPDQTRERSNAADRHTLLLIALAAVLVAALLVLTIAQVTRRRHRVRLGLMAAGVGLAGASTLVFFWLEVLGR